MNLRFQIGIVGCGKIARRHVEACLLSDMVDICAFVDPTPQRARDLAAEFQVDAPIVDSLDKVLGKLDGAVIAAPNHFHRPLAEQCAAAGVHTLIEKPIAGTLQDATAICEAHEAAGTVCGVGFVTRFAANNQQMQRLIQSGYFGEIHEFAYQFGSRGGWAPLSAYNLDRKATGGGVLVVTGSHFIDRMLHWFGTPADCSLLTDSLGGPEANALATFRFNRGASTLFGTARFSKTVPMPAGFVMRTSKGIVSLIDQPAAKIALRPVDESLKLTIEPDHESGNLFQAQLEDFVRACQSNGRPAVDGREALRSVELTEQLYANCEPLNDAEPCGRILAVSANQEQVSASAAE